MVGGPCEQAQRAREELEQHLLGGHRGDADQRAAGPAPLGFGNEGEGTEVSYGPDPNAKFITTWFRKSFFVSDPTVFDSLALNVVREDGVLVYLNGSPVWRDNLPPDPVSYLTTALSDVAGSEATNTFHSVGVDPGYLVPGTNVLAAELHLYSPASPGLRCALELSGRRTVFADVDSDHDGMPDAWEILNFRSTSATAGADPDGDGMSNLQEYIAGTNPNDIDDVLRITYIARGDVFPDFTTLHWTSKPTRAYTIQARPALNPGTLWMDSIGYGLGVSNSTFNTGTTNSLEFYRIRAYRPLGP